MSRILWYPGYEVLLPDIVRAENCALFDAAGRRYVDLECGVWCTSVGHGHPRVLRALADQAGRIGHTGFCYSSGVVEEAAEEILALLGFEEGAGKCVFLCSGSEAVEYGVRAAQGVAERPLMMTMADSYFGAYGSAARKREAEWFVFDWMGCAGCAEERECDAACERWAAIPFDRIGGFLFEPGSSSGLVRFPPKKLVGAIVRVVQEDGGLLVVNEVTTGAGRTGEWFGYQHYGVAPDIVAMGKGIGNGYPVSVAAFGPAAAARLGGRPIKYAQSHQNDPGGAAVAREVVRVIEEERLIARGRALGAQLIAGLEAIRARSECIAAVRGRGMMAAVEVAGAAGGPAAERVQRKLVERGFIVCRRPGLNVLRIDPALTVPAGDVEEFLRVFEEVLASAGNAAV